MHITLFWSPPLRLFRAVCTGRSLRYSELGALRVHYTVHFTRCERLETIEKEGSKRGFYAWLKNTVVRTITHLLP